MASQLGHTSLQRLYIAQVYGVDSFNQYKLIMLSYMLTLINISRLNYEVLLVAQPYFKRAVITL